MTGGRLDGRTDGGSDGQSGNYRLSHSGRIEIKYDLDKLFCKQISNNVFPSAEKAPL